MNRAEHMHQVLLLAFHARSDVEVWKSPHRIDVVGLAGSHEGKHWKVAFTIPVEAPALPKPSYLVAEGVGLFRRAEQTGDTPPAEVVEYARAMTIKLRNSSYSVAGMTDLERRMLTILRNVADFAHGEELPFLLKEAVQEAREVSNTFFEDVTAPDYEDYGDEELPSSFKV